MAILRPLVIIDGQIQRLPVGDTIDGQDLTVDLTCNEAGGTAKFAPVYVDAPDSFQDAQADNATTKEVIGFTIAAVANAAVGTVQLEGTLEGTTGEWDAITGDTGGLTAGDIYWLDPDTAGMITNTAPTTDGDFVVPLGEAISTTKFLIDVDSSVLL